MNLVASIKSAGRGWAALLAEKPEWRDHVDFGPEGVNAASIVYFGAVIIVMVAHIAAFGMIAPAVMVISLINFLLPALSLILATMGARKILGFATPVAALVVPGLYLHAVMLLVSGLLAIAGLGLAGAVAGLLAFFLYKLARAVPELDIGKAIAYSVLNIVLLIGLPLVIYLAVQAIAT